MFLSYQRYQEIGGKIQNENDYRRAEYRSRMKITEETRNRIPFDPSDDLKERLEYLTLELVDGGLLTTGKEVTSESNDGRSVSYDNSKGKVENLIKQYLPEFTQPSITSVKVIRT